MRYGKIGVGRALNHLQELPGFDKAFLDLSFKRIRREADNGCRAIAETQIGPRTFERGDIDKLDMEADYEQLCSTFPTLMTGMVAVTTKERCYASALKVSSDHLHMNMNECESHADFL